jgi:hypothetical protein
MRIFCSPKRIFANMRCFFSQKTTKRGCGIHEKEKEEAVFKAGRKGRRSQRKELRVTYGAG